MLHCPMESKRDVSPAAMRRASGALVVLMLIGATAITSVQAQRVGEQPASSSLEVQILQVSQAWFTAVGRRDVDALDRLMVDDFLSIQQAPSGVAVITKDTQLDALRKNPVGTALERDLSAIRVRGYGDTAILTALATFTAQGAGGQTQKSGAMIVEVWVREGAAWRLSHFQTTDVPARGAK